MTAASIASSGKALRLVQYLCACGLRMRRSALLLSWTTFAHPARFAARPQQPPSLPWRRCRRRDWRRMERPPLRLRRRSLRMRQRPARMPQGFRRVSRHPSPEAPPSMARWPKARCRPPDLLPLASLRRRAGRPTCRWRALRGCSPRREFPPPASPPCVADGPSIARTRTGIALITPGAEVRAK